MAGFAPRFATSPPEKNRFAEKELRLLQIGQYRVCRPMGEFAFLGVFRSHDMAVGRSYRFDVFVRIWTKIGRFCGPKANMKHLKHLEHLMWMFGLLFCKHFKELGGKVNDGVH